MGGGASKQTQGEIVEAAPPPRPRAAETAAAAPAVVLAGGAAPPKGGAGPHEPAAELATPPAAPPVEATLPAPALVPAPPAEDATAAAGCEDKPLVPEKPKAAAPGARRPRPGSRGPRGAGDDAQPGPAAQQQPGTPQEQPAAEAASAAAASAAAEADGDADANPAPVPRPPADAVDGGAPEAAEVGAAATLKADEALPEPHREDTPLGDVTNLRCEPVTTPAPASQAEPRRKAPLGALPALGSLPERELPAEELVPLAEFEKIWQGRSSDDSLLDRVVGPMVHDALSSTDWRVHWEALQYLSQNSAKASGTPGELTAAVSEVVIAASKNKMPKVFLASLAVLDALLQDPRTSSLDQDEFVALFRGRQMLLPVEAAQAGSADDDCLLVLLDQAEEAGGSSKASSPQQAAAAALRSCIRGGRVPLSEAAWPLLGRVDDRLRSEAAQGKMDKKEAALGPKCLATNFRMLGGWIKEFGLQNGGLFRRALLLPLVLRGLASEHSKVRAAAGEALVPMLASSGDLEERLWALLPSKRRRAAKELLASQEVPPGPCHEDHVPKKSVVSTDARAAGFICVSELTAEVWAGLQSGQAVAAQTTGCGDTDAAGPAKHHASADVDEGRSEALRGAVASKSWKDRCDAIARVSEELTASAAVAELVEGAKALQKSPRRRARHDAQVGWGTDWRKHKEATVDSAGAPVRDSEPDLVPVPPQPQLSHYVLCGYQVSLLQSSLVSFLGDSVTAVFIAAADLLQKVCERVPADAAPAVWEPSMGPLVARLPDTSAKVRAKASEAILALAGLRAGVAGEAVAAAVAGAGPAGEAADQGRCAGPRLQLLARIVEQAREQNVADAWSDGAWAALTRFAAGAAEHRNAEVRKESALLLTCCGNIGGRAGSAAEAAMASLQAAAQQKPGRRPGTANGRPGLEAMVVTSTTYGGDSTAPADAGGAASEGSEEELRQQAASKNWKDRAACVALLAGRVAEGPQFMDGGAQGAPSLSSCTLGGHRVPLLQSVLAATLGDTVTGVFAQAAGLLQLACGRLPPRAGEAFLEPLLPPLLARLQDTSSTVRSKAMDVTLSVATSNNSALGELIAQSVCCEGAAGGAPPPTPGGSSKGGGGGRDADRGALARLQLLAKLAQQAPRGTPRTSRSPRAPRTPKAPWDQVCQQEQLDAEWKEDTWHSLADYAVKAAEHRSGDVRRESAALLAALSAGGQRAAAAAEAAAERIKAVAMEKTCKRPGTGGGRLGTAAGRGGSLGASGRLNTTASRAPSLGAGGRQPSRGPASLAGSLAGARPSDDDSDASVCSQAPPDSPPVETEEDGVKFYDVRTACPGADVVPDLEEGEAALKEALQLAEPLQDESRDHVAPLVGLFGEGWVRCFYSKSWQCRVAALTHLAASTAQRLESSTDPGQAPGTAGDLFGGALRAVIEGLGDQNVRVYAEACMATAVIVPAFTSIVDGRLLVSHLAPLLRLLCTRMGDLKEAVRTQTTQALFRLLRPPVGEVLSPGAVAVLILRHLAPGKQEGEVSPPRGPSGKGATVAWLCRLAALRDLVKEYPQASLMQPGSTHPGEWLRLSAGLGHSDPTVRHESARLLALACKMHLRGTAAEGDHEMVKEAWVAALRDVPAKSLAQVRKLLKLPERQPDDPKASSQGGVALSASAPWEVPPGLAVWAGCPQEVLSVLRAPAEGSEDAVAVALRALTEATVAFGESGAQRRGASLEEAFAGICAAAQRCLASPVGADRAVFLGAVRLCQSAITHMASALSGLDISMGLAKVFPTLMERTSLAGAGDVRLGVASDKLVQQLAKHPKVGCESVTKMVVAAVSRTERPVRPLVLLRTLLNDFGLRLCAQRDIVSQLLAAVGTQLERLGGPGSASGADGDESLRPQLVGVLATCSQFSMDTVKLCMGELETSQRQLLLAALHQAPDPRLVALGAAAADSAMEGHVAGSGIRALSRSASRGGLSESPSVDCAEGDDDNARRSGSRRRLPRPEDSEASDAALSPTPGQRRRRKRFDPTQPQEKPPATGELRASPPLSEVSTASSFGEVSARRPPRSPARAQKPQPWPEADLSRGFARSAEQPLRPPAPLGLSTLRGPGRGGGIPMPRPPESSHRSDGEGLGHPAKSRSQDGLGALADVLAQMEGAGGLSRTR